MAVHYSVGIGHIPFFDVTPSLAFREHLGEREPGMFQDLLVQPHRMTLPQKCLRMIATECNGVRELII